MIRVRGRLPHVWTRVLAVLASLGGGLSSQFTFFLFALLVFGFFVPVLPTTYSYSMSAFPLQMSSLTDP